jgi:hypothetical protein
MLTGFSMSTAAKTTPSVRLKLEEAQEEIGALRLALAQQKLASLHGSRQESSIDTTNTNTNKSTPTENNKEQTKAAEKLGSELIDQITESQAIGAALA